ncbi:EAL domain-containing protein [Zoogloea sp.]|uniref:EAL domain-containing protein n=1 Tax=Zoogloea sp. TaxID=49181 RepID=UPI002628E76B|nr:EAL domain-containing protein [Zoogloea sp.]MDD3354237.1 EAL domain-containing protein [Zoogloea sp.]
MSIAPPLNLLTRNFLDGLPATRTPGKQLYRQPDGGVLGDWAGLALGSAFQPIVRADSGELFGREAFLRSGVGEEQGLSPWTLFSANTDDDRLIALDRLARTVHLLNALVGGHEGRLFLNVNGRLLAAVSDDHGRAFRRVVDALGLLPEQIVIETPVEASQQPDLLAFVLRNYRNNGFQVAVNVDSVAQWQAVSRTLWTQYVKVDYRQLAATPGGAAAQLTRLEGLRDEAALVLTHVEQAVPELRGENLLLQGHAFGHPVRLSPLPALVAAHS